MIIDTADTYILDASKIFKHDPSSESDILYTLVLLGERNQDGSFKSSILDFLAAIATLHEPNVYWQKLTTLIDQGQFQDLSHEIAVGAQRIKLITGE